MLLKVGTANAEVGLVRCGRPANEGGHGEKARNAYRIIRHPVLASAGANMLDSVSSVLRHRVAAFHELKFASS